MSNHDSSFVFSYEEFHSLVHQFAETVPQLLLQHPVTADLALQIEKLQLTEALASRFTLAIVGQMRVGKSTLLNALIGRKLAPTGVTETTATINWFRYAADEVCSKFRVHWNDGSTEDIPLQRVSDWVGTQDNAHKTRSLDFFADSEFLKTANIVDTPGTRSVLESHEKAIQGFIAEKRAEKLESQTLFYGGRADAVLYVINPIGRAADRDLLQLFGERTRLPGASAYNSIAVVQKWEHLEPDPVVEVQKKCTRLRSQLRDNVAEVLPTSGLLAKTCMELSEDTWYKLSKLAVESPSDIVNFLLRTETYFCADKTGTVLAPDEREELRRRIEWPALCFILRHAQAQKIDDGSALRRAIWQASGIDRLKQILKSRFFSLSALIQASTVLRKTWDPCNIALLKLREITEQRQKYLSLGQQTLNILNDIIHREAALEPVMEYVQASLSSVENEFQLADNTRQRLDETKYQAAKNFHLLDADIDCLKLMEISPEDELSEEELSELHCLFGKAGPAVWIRLGLDSESVLNEETLANAWERLAHWTEQKMRTSGDLQRICTHAVDRLEMILDYLEEKLYESNSD